MERYFVDFDEDNVAVCDQKFMPHDHYEIPLEQSECVLKLFPIDEFGLANAQVEAMFLCAELNSTL